MQRDLRKILPRNAILAGHSLENDLCALRLVHHRVIDTAICYHHNSGPPYKPALRWLTTSYLDRAIQVGEHGHDSTEDARATMDLVRLRLRKGHAFGTHVPTSESIFLQLSRAGKKTSLMTGASHVINAHSRFGVNCFRCVTGGDVLRACGTQTARSSQFVLAHATLKAAGDDRPLADEAAATGAAGASSDPPPPPADGDMRQQAAAMDRDLRLLLQKAPPATAVFIVCAPATAGVHARRLRRSRSPKTGEGTWTPAEEQELEEAVALARRGKLFCLVK